MRARVDHVTFRPKGDGFECHHCGDSYEMKLPAPIRVLTAAAKAFTADHRRCKKPDKDPFAEPPIAKELSIDERAERWFESRDTGLSSTTIWRFFRGRGRTDDDRTPSDPSDFGRCHRLLTLIPEWRARLGELGAARPEWKLLVDGWAEMERIYERDLPTGKSMDLWALMRRANGEDQR